MVNLTKINKKEVAFRQLKTAIHLFITDDDSVSTYTLVRASEEILDKLCAKSGLPRSVMHQGINDLVISPEHKKVLFLKLNKPKNYFKHADRDADEEMEWASGVIEHFISDCISMYKRLTPESAVPCEFEAFSVIYRIRNKDMFEPSQSDDLDYNIENISKLIDEEGLQWVYNHIIEACCKLRP